MPRFYIPEIRTDLVKTPSKGAAAIQGALGGYKLGTEIRLKEQEAQRAAKREERLAAEHADRMKRYTEEYALSKARVAQTWEKMAADAQADEEKRKAFIEAYRLSQSDPNVERMQALEGMQTAEGAETLYKAFQEQDKQQAYMGSVKAAQAELEDLREDGLIEDEEYANLGAQIQSKAGKGQDISGELQDLLDRREKAIREKAWDHLTPKIQEAIDALPEGDQRDEMQMALHNFKYSSQKTRTDPKEFLETIEQVGYREKVRAFNERGGATVGEPTIPDVTAGVGPSEAELQRAADKREAAGRPRFTGTKTRTFKELRGKDGVAFRSDLSGVMESGGDPLEIFEAYGIDPASMPPDEYEALLKEAQKASEEKQKRMQGGGRRLRMREGSRGG